MMPKYGIVEVLVASAGCDACRAGAHVQQNQSPSGTESNAGSQQKVWVACSHPSPSHNNNTSSSSSLPQILHLMPS